MKFKARLDGVTFASLGCKLLGGFYGAVGDSPRPTVILLHGVPGVEKNLDLAYALRDVGWNTLYFHYRGCWGSEGTYSLNGQLDDLQAATEWILRQPSVDTEKLVLLGNSMGGYMALAGGARDRRFHAVVAICPLIDPTTAPLSQDWANEFAQMLHGITAKELKKEWDNLVPIERISGALGSRKVLLITAGMDEFFPPTHYERFMNELPTLQRQQMKNADHSFCTCRRELVEAVVQWLKEIS